METTVFHKSFEFKSHPLIPLQEVMRTVALRTTDAVAARVELDCGTRRQVQNGSFVGSTPQNVALAHVAGTKPLLVKQRTGFSTPYLIILVDRCCT